MSLVGLLLFLQPSCMVHRKIIFEIQFLSWLFSTLYTNHNNGNEHPNLDQSSDTFELRPQFADPKGVKPVSCFFD